MADSPRRGAVLDEVLLVRGSPFALPETSRSPGIAADREAQDKLNRDLLVPSATLGRPGRRRSRSESDTNDDTKFNTLQPRPRRGDGPSPCARICEQLTSAANQPRDGAHGGESELATTSSSVRRPRISPQPRLDGLLGQALVGQRRPSSELPAVPAASVRLRDCRLQHHRLSSLHPEKPETSRASRHADLFERRGAPATSQLRAGAHLRLHDAHRRFSVARCSAACRRVYSKRSAEAPIGLVHWADHRDHWLRHQSAAPSHPAAPPAYWHARRHMSKDHTSDGAAAL